MKLVQKVLTAINKIQHIMKIAICVSEIAEFASQRIAHHFGEVQPQTTSDNADVKQ